MYRRLATALLAAAIAAACGGVVDPSQNQVDTHTGTIQPGAGHGDIWPFSVSKSGEISVTVTSLTPTVPTNTYFGILLGQSISGQCTAISSPNQFAFVGTAAISGPITPGSYCIFIYDEGFFTVAETYALKISHP